MQPVYKNHVTSTNLCQYWL